MNGVIKTQPPQSFFVDLFVKVCVIILDKAFSLGHNQYWLFVCRLFCVPVSDEGVI